MKNNIFRPLFCVLKRSCNYGFANATDLMCCGGRPEAVRKKLAAANPNPA